MTLVSGTPRKWSFGAGEWTQAATLQVKFLSDFGENSLRY
jgi:hypothetical protein